jgi:hypothetical protein
MSDAQEIQTGHAGASSCSAATKQSQLDAGDTERSADALRGIVKQLDRLEEQVPLIIGMFVFRFFEKKAFHNGQMAMLQAIRDLIAWEIRRMEGKDDD